MLTHSQKIDTKDFPLSTPWPLSLALASALVVLVVWRLELEENLREDWSWRHYAKLELTHGKYISPTLMTFASVSQFHFYTYFELMPVLHSVLNVKALVEPFNQENAKVSMGLLRDYETSIFAMICLQL